MKSRKQVLMCLNVTSCLFLLVQLYFLSTSTTDIRDELTQPHSSHNLLHHALELVHTLTELFSSGNIQLILIDPWLLNLTETRPRTDGGTTFITLAIIAKDEIDLDHFLSSTSPHLSCSPCHSLLPMYISLSWSSEVLTHLFCVHDSDRMIRVHLVIFYDHTNSYLWYGHIQGMDQRPAAYIGQRHQGVVNRFPVVPVYVSMSDSSSQYLLYLPQPLSSLHTQLPGSLFLPCNYTRAAKFYAQTHVSHDQDEGDALMHDFKGAQFKQQAKSLLREAKAVLDELEVPFWISSGTCLGWFRQCDIIGHSKDVDLGIAIQHYQPQLVGRFKQAGFSLMHVMGKVSDSLQISFGKDGIKLDLYFFYTLTHTDGRVHMWNGATDATTGAKYRYMFPGFRLCWTELLGLNVRVPCNTQRYVEANYGQTWFNEQREWDWKLSPPNAQANGHWSEKERSQVIQIF